MAHEMALIRELTPKQQEALASCRDRWFKTALSTDRIDRRRAEGIIKNLYKVVLRKKYPNRLLILDSPLAAWEVISTFPADSPLTLSTTIERLWKHMWALTRAHIAPNLGEYMKRLLWEQLNSHASHIALQVHREVKSQRKDFLWPYLEGNFHSGYFCFHDFCNKHLKIPFLYQEEWDAYLATSKLSLIYALDNVCILSEKPTTIKMKGNVLHSDNSPSIQYADTRVKVWCLNGVRVPKEVVITPAHSLDPEIAVREKNAQIRREIVKKIGAERLIQKLHAKVLDKQGDYELLDLSHHFPNARIKPIYLKMKNPSIGTWHVEGVPPNITTCQQAINWRRYGDKDRQWKPENLT